MSEPVNLATAVEFQQELARLQAVIDSLRQEVLEQRREIAGLREERRAILGADRPPHCTETGGM
jgi:cell division protein FtsB